jgi:hypothetical protein
MKLRLFVCAALAALVFGCGSSSDDDGIDPPVGDEDADGISDADEGAASGTDTDGDGTPDYQDTDSDGDGIEDYREAGDADPGTRPIDTDNDGTPDFQDLDADGNGVPDSVEGTGDIDGDGKGDFQDVDNDGDFINDPFEIGDDPSNPVDTDGDGNPDYRDTDSDNDTIGDLYESTTDFDMDQVGNWRDLDSDGDCRSDQLESGGVTPPRDTDADGRYDFVDRDSDDDGIPDATEDTNCNGVRDGAETDAGNADTDGDGVSDLVEDAAGTNPNNPADNPQANGDFVFVVPYQDPPTPMDDDLDFTSRLQQVDMYVIVDRSGSMSQEITTVRNNLSTVRNNLTCPPNGSGNPATCIPDLWAGAGTVGYSGSGAQTYANYADLQPNANFSGLPITEPGGCCAEPLNFSVWSAITGQGTAAQSGCSLSGGTLPPRSTCAGSPAANAGFQTFGYPCFRDGSLPVILLATDEPPLSAGDTNKCPAWATVVLPAMNARSAKLVGIGGSGFAGTSVETDLRTMATNTGAVDSQNGNAPLVFDGSGTNSATAIENGIRTLANNIPLDMSAPIQDDPSDAVNAVTAFVDHLETLQQGTALCANMLNDIDTNGDTFDDAYVDVRAGTGVCWKLIAKMNTTVPATDVPQLYRATVEVVGDGVTTLDTRDVFFLVPPQPLDEPVQ